MKKVIDCELVKFTFEENLLGELCIFAKLHGNSTANVYTKESARAAVKKLEKAIPVL